jgi:hypothetical protein
MKRPAEAGLEGECGRRSHQVDLPRFGFGQRLTGQKIHNAFKLHGDAILIRLPVEPRDEGTDNAEVPQKRRHTHAGIYNVRGFLNELAVLFIEPHSPCRSEKRGATVDLGEQKARLAHPFLNGADVFTGTVLVRQVHDEAASRDLLRCMEVKMHNILVGDL